MNRNPQKMVQEELVSSGNKLTRRNFVQLGALAGVSLPPFLACAADSLTRQQGGDGDSASEGPVLVVLQLAGGNDGLNTVIPCEDSRYFDARPTLAIAALAALSLGDDTGFGFHPNMAPLHRLCEEGDVSVVQNVGYPNPSRSHFRSMEIWHTARPNSEDASSGWLGRTLAQSTRAALNVGDGPLPVALTAPGVHVPSLQNLDWLEELFSARGQTMRRTLRQMLSRDRTGDPEYVRRTTQTTLDQLDVLEDVRSITVPVEYPRTALGNRLEWAGRMIAGGYPSRIYYLSLSGFDTDARQKDAHAALLEQYADAVAAFQEHMRRSGNARRTVLLTFSEFGRRVRENGSEGTDHGYAGPMFVVSESCRGGVIGDAPDLSKLVEGDIPYRIDFRSIYATVLQEVLGIQSELILGKSFKKIELLNPEVGRG